MYSGVGGGVVVGWVGWGGLGESGGSGSLEGGCIILGWVQILSLRR